MFRMLENIGEIRYSLHGLADRFPDFVIVYQKDDDLMIASNVRFTDVGEGSKEPNGGRFFIQVARSIFIFRTMTRTKVFASMGAPFACSDIVDL